MATRLVRYARQIRRTSKQEGQGGADARRAVKVAKKAAKRPSVGVVTRQEKRVARLLGRSVSTYTTAKEGQGVRQKARRKAKRS